MSALRLAVYTDATAWGGAEIVLGHLLAALGDDVTVTVLGVDDDVVARLAARRPRSATVVLPPINGKRDLRAMWRHRQALARLRPDVLHVNLQVPRAAALALAVAVTVRGLRVVAVEHLPMPIGSPLRRRLKRWAAGRLAAHVAVGERVAREVEALAGLPQRSIRAVPNGVPDPGPPAPRRRPEGAVPVVGTIARLEPQKGVDVLLRAATALPGVRVVVAGDGPAAGDLRRLAGESGLGDRVGWPGWVADPGALLR